MNAPWFVGGLAWLILSALAYSLLRDSLPSCAWNVYVITLTEPDGKKGTA